jgi:hypothetical protein
MHKPPLQHFSKKGSMRHYYHYQFTDKETKVQAGYFTQGHTDSMRRNDKFITNHVILATKTSVLTLQRKYDCH